MGLGGLRWILPKIFMVKVTVRGVAHGYDLTAPLPDRDRPTLVFVHGWLLSRQYWQPVIKALAPHYQCLTYDLRGFGDSLPERPAPAPYDLQAYGEDLRHLLEALKLRSVWLVGHSLGGSIALWAAHGMPDRVRGVICINSGGGIYLKEAFDRFRQMGQKLVGSRFRWLQWLPGLDLAFGRMMVKRSLGRRWGKQRLQDFLGADGAAALGSLLETTTEEEVHKLPQIVAQLRQPVYFLAGQEDRVMAKEYVYHLASFHFLFERTGENVVEIADCGHLAMVEQTQAVIGAMERILEIHVPQGDRPQDNPPPPPG